MHKEFGGSNGNRKMILFENNPLIKATPFRCSEHVDEQASRDRLLKTHQEATLSAVATTAVVRQRKSKYLPPP